MRRHYKTRFPSANVPHRNKDVSTDPFLFDVPAHNDGIPGHVGCTMAQIYTGITIHFTKVYPELLAILQKFTLCLLSHKFRIHFVTFLLIQENQIISRVTVLKLNNAMPSRTSYATIILGDKHTASILAPMYLVCGLLIQCSGCRISCIHYTCSNCLWLCP